MELARLAQNRSDSNYARFWSERPPSKLVSYARISQLRQNWSATPEFVSYARISQLRQNWSATPELVSYARIGQLRQNSSATPELVSYARIRQLRQNSSAYAYPLISAYAHMLRFQAHRVSVLSDLLKQPDKQKSARPPLELVTAR